MIAQVAKTTLQDDCPSRSSCSVEYVRNNVNSGTNDYQVILASYAPDSIGTL